MTANARMWASGNGRRILRAELAGALVFLGGLALLAAAWWWDDRWFDRHVFRYGCAVTTGDRALVIGERIALAVLAVLACAVAAPRARRWVARRSAGEAMRSLAGIGVAVVLALMVGEGALRWRRRTHGADAVPVTFEGGKPFSALPAAERTAYGWRLAPHTVTYARVGREKRVVRYDVNRHGYRDVAIDAEPDEDRPTILFAGESVLMGWGLGYEETISTRVGRALDVQPVNLGVHGYGHDQAYLRLIEELPRFRHPVAVVAMTMPEGLERNMDDDRAHLVLAPGGGLVLVPAADDLGGRAELLRMWREIVPSRGPEALRVARAILEATAAAARARGALPLFVFTKCGDPCRLRDGETEPEVARALLDGLPHVNVAIGLNRTIPEDVHPTAEAAGAIADAIVAALRGKLPEPLSAQRR